MSGRFELVLPALNAGAYWDAWLEGLRAQSLQPSRVWVIDSASTDGTAERARAAGFEVRGIERADFDHGGTRQWALEELCRAELVVFLTHDAILAGPESLAELIAAFDDPKVGAAYGRQLPRARAGAIEAHARLFNYPEAGRVKSLADAAELGIKTAFLSNSFAAYRRSALLDVGGFPSNVIMCEDTYAAARLLMAGWKVAYRSTARVLHSHGYSLAEEFRRYFDVGVFYFSQPWIREGLGGAESEGLRYLRSELAYLARRAPARIPEALLRTGLKLAGYRLGSQHKRLPPALRERFSMHKGYWRRAAPKAPAAAAAKA